MLTASRLYRPTDAQDLANIFNRAVSETASSVYSPEQIAAWLDGGMTADEAQARCSDGRAVWVAVDDTDTAIAFIDLEDDGHIEMLFCQPEWTRRGVASALYRRLEAAARTRGMARLYVEASELALPFFMGKGFALLHRNNFTMDGTAVHNYTMEKRFGPVSGP